VDAGALKKQNTNILNKASNRLNMKSSVKTENLFQHSVLKTAQKYTELAGSLLPLGSDRLTAGA
jgi:hypothetical protein